MAAREVVRCLRALTAPPAAGGSSSISLSSRVLAGLRAGARGGHHLQGSSLLQVSRGLWMGVESCCCIGSSGRLSLHCCRQSVGTVPCEVGLSPR